LIKSIKIKGSGFEKSLSAVKEGKITGERAVKNDTYVSYIGTFDGTGPEFTPVGARSS
jgi:alpha-galactosidase